MGARKGVTVLSIYGLGQAVRNVDLLVEAQQAGPWPQPMTVACRRQGYGTAIESAGQTTRFFGL